MLGRGFQKKKDIKMQKYQQTYIKGSGHDINDPTILNNIVSELSGKRADDIHHIKYLMTGVDRQDYPFERLIALTRDEHNKFGDKKQYFDYLLWAHYLYIDTQFMNDEYFPDCIFDWTGDTNAHENMFHFYMKCIERNYYVEMWEMPDHCHMQVYNSAGNVIKEMRKETKFEIFERSVTIPKPVGV